MEDGTTQEPTRQILRGLLSSNFVHAALTLQLTTTHHVRVTRSVRTVFISTRRARCFLVCCVHPLTRITYHVREYRKPTHASTALDASFPSTYKFSQAARVEQQGLRT